MRQFCNVVYYTLITGGDEKDVAEVEEILAAPLDPADAEAQKRVRAALSNLHRLR